MQSFDLCPDLFTAAVAEKYSEKDIQATFAFLKCALKFKIKRFGISTINDRELKKVHKGFPFRHDKKCIHN